MGSRNLDEDHILATLMQNDDELPGEDTDSEIADHESEDDVQSDTEEAFIDEVQGERPTPSGECNLRRAIMYYNQTKGGLDTLDQMCSLMSCSRKTNRWPMAFLYGMINIACINAYIIYKHNVNNKGEKPLSHKKIMKNLSLGLSSSFMRRRLEAPTLKRYLRDNIFNRMPNEVPDTPENNTDEPVA